MAILITGCSSGIGFACAVSLKEQGYQVIASARRDDDVQKLKALGLEAINLDLSKSDSIRLAVKEALKLSNNNIDVLINNAGYGQAGAVEDLSREVIRTQFETNVFGLIELTNLLIPHMREKARGRIINISSVLGVVAMPFRGAYNASKFALEGFSDTLRLELSNSPIYVSLIEPGPIESRFRDNAVDVTLNAIDKDNSVHEKTYHAMVNEFKGKKSDSIFTLQPEAVVKKIRHATSAKKPKPRYGVTFAAHALMFLRRILPTRSLDWVLKIISGSEMKASK